MFVCTKIDPIFLLKMFIERIYAISPVLMGSLSHITNQILLLMIDKFSPIPHTISLIFKKYHVTCTNMFPRLDLDNRFQVFSIAIILAIVLGIFTSVFFIVINKDSYSAIYIIPDSITRNVDNNTVLYAYGVKSSETGKIEYTLDTYVDTTLIKSKQFSLNPGEILDEQDQITLNTDAKYPLKISLKLTTTTATEEVHFWLK
jgi:hypothetical protein